MDTLAVLSLLLTAFWRGYCWNESIATVFAAGDGLWWRANLEALSHPDGALETRGTDNTEADNYGNEHTNDSPYERIYDFLIVKSDPILAPLSQERVLSAVLFVVAFIKIIAMVKASTNSGIRLNCIAHWHIQRANDS